MEKKDTNTVASENNRKAELQRYEDAIKKLALAKSSYIFNNENADHASIVIKSILKYAENEVAIFDDDLSGDVSGKSSDFLDIVREFVNKPSRVLKLVVKNKTKENEQESSLVVTLRELVKLYPDKIQVKIASKEFLEAVETAASALNIDADIHFAVGGDSNAFRLEFPAGKRKAFCSFNNKAYSSVLMSVFTLNFKSCSDYFAE